MRGSGVLAVSTGRGRMPFYCSDDRQAMPFIPNISDRRREDEEPSLAGLVRYLRR